MEPGLSKSAQARAKRNWFATTETSPRRNKKDGKSGAQNSRTKTSTTLGTLGTLEHPLHCIVAAGTALRSFRLIQHNLGDNVDINNIVKQAMAITDRVITSTPSRAASSSSNTSAGKSYRICTMSYRICTQLSMLLIGHFFVFTCSCSLFSCYTMSYHTMSYRICTQLSMLLIGHFFVFTCSCSLFSCSLLFCSSFRFPLL